MVDPQQLRRELATLRLADAESRELDPTLPIRLLKARAETERAWAGMAGERSWIDDLMADDGGIAQAAVRLLGMRAR